MRWLITSKQILFNFSKFCEKRRTILASSHWLYSSKSILNVCFKVCKTQIQLPNMVNQPMNQYSSQYRWRNVRDLPAPDTNTQAVQYVKARKATERVLYALPAADASTLERRRMAEDRRQTQWKAPRSPYSKKQQVHMRPKTAGSRSGPTR